MEEHVVLHEGYDLADPVSEDFLVTLYGRLIELVRIINRISGEGSIQMVLSIKEGTLCMTLGAPVVNSDDKRKTMTFYEGAIDGEKKLMSIRTCLRTAFLNISIIIHRCKITKPERKESIVGTMSSDECSLLCTLNDKKIVFDFIIGEPIH